MLHTDFSHTHASHTPRPDREPALSGAQIRRLMRRHGKTIRGIATRYGITMKRVREVRATGVKGFLASEWYWMITGEWLDDAKSMQAGAA